MKGSRIGTLLLIGCLIIAVVVVLTPDVAHAAPGGAIARSVAKTWVGKVALVSVFIIFLPFFLYSIFKEKVRVRKTRGDLQALSKLNESFRWSALNEHAHIVIRQVYSAWSKADAEKAQEWMTDWYWQNQQMTVLDEWESRGLKNQCTLKEVNNVDPLHVEYSENEPGDGEGSRLTLVVSVKLQDYLQEVDTGVIVEGDETIKSRSSLWTLLLQGGKWKLTMIENSSQARDAYIKIANDLEEAKEHLSKSFKYRNNLQREQINK